MTKTIDIDIERSGSHSVVHVEGDINWETSAKLRSAILEQFEKRGVRYLLIDLHRVGHMDSSGVSTLIEGLQAAQKKDGCFILSGLTSSPRRMLELTRLASVFEMVDSPAEPGHRSRRAA